jgi:hypothetical protein
MKHFFVLLSLGLFLSLCSSVQAQNRNLPEGVSGRSTAETKPASGQNTRDSIKIFTYSGKIETWTVPANVYQLTIEARGAEGSNTAESKFRPGKGAIITGTISVTPGQSLKILVGQQRSASEGNGGGGGSFVTDSTNKPLIIAGGGGGSGNTEDELNKQGQAGNRAGSGISGGSIGDINGTSGATNGIAGYQSGAGGGLIANASVRIAIGAGKAFVNGGGGGNVGLGYVQGGFGGGGAGSGAVVGGGGGGYSGGGSTGSGSGLGGVGAGGSSYNGGSNQTNKAGANTGNGKVTITYTPCAPFTATLINDGPLTCSKKLVNLTAGGGSKGATYAFSVAAVQLGDSTSTTASVTHAGAYSVTVTNTDGCSATAITTVDSTCTASGRLAADDSYLQVKLAPNPLENEQLRAIITGATNQVLHLRLLEPSGRLIRDQHWQQAGNQEQVEWNLSGQLPGAYLLEATTEASADNPSQRQTVKVIKP